MLTTGLILHATLLLAMPAGSMWQGPPAKLNPSFTFVKQAYYQRYQKGNMREFTPKDQPHLDKWKDMVTVNHYPDAKDGEALAAKANAVLTNYQANGAKVVKTDSKARTASKPAEHLIVVLFPRKQFIEAAFARFVLQGGTGYSIVYSHRIYGAKAGDPMSKWLLANGEVHEKALMAMSKVPGR